MSNKNLDNRILKLVEAKSGISADMIAQSVGVSPSTVRRKLNELQKNGLVKRSRGEVRINSDSNFAQSFTFRKHINSLAKKRIALEAVKLIKNGDVIFLDGSSSVYFIAQYLNQFDGIKVITNGIDTLSLLSENQVTAYSTGGVVSPLNRSILTGRFAENMIESIHANICFFSAETVDDDGNVWNLTDDECSVRLKMIQNSSLSVFICDSSKLHKKSSFSFCNLSGINCMVCDEHPGPDIEFGACSIRICAE